MVFFYDLLIFFIFNCIKKLSDIHTTIEIDNGFNQILDDIYMTNDNGKIMVISKIACRNFENVKKLLLKFFINMINKYLNSFVKSKN